MKNRILDELDSDSIVIDEGIYSPGFHFFATIAAFLLIPVIAYKTFLLIPFPLFAIYILLTTREVIEVEFNNRKYRDGTKFLGKVYGEWLPIPKIKYVSVIGRDLKSEGKSGIGGLITPQMLVGNIYLNYSTYEIRLFNSISRRINLVRVDSHKEAISIAKKIAEKLNEKLLDATQKPPKFIEL